jgi:hypothetical protein
VRLPRAYRSLPRPSSPPRAKASTVRLFALDLITRVYIGWIPITPRHLASIVKERSRTRTAVPDRSEKRNRRDAKLGWATAEAFRPPVLRRSTRRSRKEVIQPQVPLRLPCYDFAPVTELTLGGCVLAVRPPASGPSSFHGVTGGVYKARERIHRGVADPRLLAIPTSRSRVADSDPHLDRLLAIGSPSRVCDALYRPL